MKRSERNSDSFDDAQVDQLLRRFFAHETPEEFRSDVAQLESAPIEIAPAERERLPAGARIGAGRLQSWALSVLAALAVALAATALWFSTARRPGVPPDVVNLDDVHPATIDRNAARGTSSTGPVDYSLSESVVPVESLRYDTVHGLVEQRTNLNTTNVSFIEPESGDLLELTLPELVIEVFPIDDDSPAAAQPVRPEPPPKLPEAKLPEEG